MAAAAGKARLLRRRVARALDVGVQVHVRQHALLDQPAVGFVVGLLDQRGQFLVQAGLQLAPAVQAAAGRAPGVDDDARQHMGAQHVLRVELLAPFQRRHARAQVGEFRGGLVHHRQRQARGEDLALDGVVVNQRQRAAGRSGRRQVARAHRGHAVEQRVAQAVDHGLVPDRGALLQLVHQLAAAHEAGVFGGLVEQRAGRRGQRIDHRRQALDQLFGVDAPCLLGDFGVICAVGHEVGTAVPRKSGHSTPRPRCWDRWGRSPCCPT